jgi:NADPH:quinone reductase-like Zn-dependent oxidoreductase
VAWTPSSTRSVRVTSTSPCNSASSRQHQHHRRRAAAQQHGVKSSGTYDLASRATMKELAELVAAGEVEIPIARVYPLEHVQDAYRELARRHAHGKIVLRP